MKNLWLIVGGIAIGIGLEKMTEKKEITSDGLFQLVMGTATVIGGIYLIKK